MSLSQRRSSGRRIIAAGLGALGAPVSNSVIVGRHPWTVTGDGTALQIVGPADDAADDVAPESALPALVAAAWERGISADQAAQLAVTSDNSAVAGRCCAASGSASVVAS